MEDLIHHIKSTMGNLSNDSKLSEEFLVMNNHYTPIALNNSNYVEIVNLDKLSKKEGEDNILSFIDGGQALLFDTPQIAIGFIRVGAVIYEGINRQSRKLEEFYVVAKKNPNISGSSNSSFTINTFPKTQFDGMKLDDDNINSFSRTQFGSSEILPRSILPIIRRLSELDMASMMINPVIDGILEARFPKELEHLMKLKNAVSVSKTCTLTLNTGESVVKRLDSNSKRISWYYNPIVKNNNPLHPADMYFAKLNDNSKYVFRVEFMSNSDVPSDSLNVHHKFNLLKNHSKDPVFLGYPYGLIDVDQYVRISNEEQEYLKTKLSVKLGRNVISEESTNAHSILDNIKF